MNSTLFSLSDSLLLTGATTIEECSSTTELTSRTGIDRMSTQTLASAISSSSPSLPSESVTQLLASISLTHSSILPLSTHTSSSSFQHSVFSSATTSSTSGVSPITTSTSLSQANSSSVRHASRSSSTTVTVTKISTLKNATGDNVVHLITVTSTYAESTAAPYTTTSITSAISTATSTATSTAVTTSVSTASPSAVTNAGTTTTSESGTAGKTVALAVVLSVTSLVAVVAIILWLRSRKPRKAPQITPFAVSEATVEDATAGNPPRRASWIGKLGRSGSLGLEPATSSSSQTYFDEIRFAYPAESAIAVDPRRSPSPSLNIRRSISTMDLLRRSWPGVPRASLSRTETRRSIETPLPHYPSSPSPNPMVSSAGFLNQDPYAWQSQAEGIAGASTDSNHGRSSSGQTLPPAYQARQDVYWTSDL